MFFNGESKIEGGGMSGRGLVKRRYKGVAGLTEADRTAIKTAFDNWSSNKLRPDPKDVEALFDKYNTYIYHTPGDRRCGSCMQFIFNYWKEQIRTWER